MQDIYIFGQTTIVTNRFKEIEKVYDIKFHLSQECVQCTTKALGLHITRIYLGFGSHMSPPLPGVSGRLGNHGAAETGGPPGYHATIMSNSVLGGRKDTVCTLGCVFIS